MAWRLKLINKYTYNIHSLFSIRRKARTNTRLTPVHRNQYPWKKRTSRFSKFPEAWNGKRRSRKKGHSRIISSGRHSNAKRASYFPERAPRGTGNPLGWEERRFETQRRWSLTRRPTKARIRAFSRGIRADSQAKALNNSWSSGEGCDESGRRAQMISGRRASPILRTNGRQASIKFK